MDDTRVSQTAPNKNRNENQNQRSRWTDNRHTSNRAQRVVTIRTCQHVERKMPKSDIVAMCSVNDQKGPTPTETNKADEPITLPPTFWHKGQVWWRSGAIRRLFSPFLKIRLVLIGLGRNLICRDTPVRFRVIGHKGTCIDRWSCDIGSGIPLGLWNRTCGNLINAWIHLTRLLDVNAPKDTIRKCDHDTKGFIPGDARPIETPARLV